MRIVDLLQEQSIDLNFKAASKQEALEQLIDLMHATGHLSNKEDYKEGILLRESLSTTGIGEGIAIPHAKVNAVKKATLVAATSKTGVDFEALDGGPCHLFFMIAAPNDANDTHLEVLSRLSTLLMDPAFREQLIHAPSPRDFLRSINSAETEKFGSEIVEETSKAKEEPKQDGYQVLAVTACPTGIAHTFMAAESLSNKAKEMGIHLKVETNGSAGVKNRLTPDEIEKATCIIVAADKKVEMNRFAGKKVILTKVADGIHKAEELLNRAVNGDAPIYEPTQNAYSTKGDSEVQTSEGVGRIIYKHLMNGVSHMLPFVIGGGLLIALAFLIDTLAGYTDNLGSNLASAAWFKSIGDVAFGFMLPVLAGYIAVSIGERPALAVGFVGGMLANLGGSGFLGALIAGFSAGYIVLGLQKLFSYLPDSLEGLKPTLFYPLLGIFLIAVAISFIINPPVALINGWLTNTLLNMGATSSIIVGIILAGMMAIDMGGPVNKAAYVVGIAALEAGNLSMMAAVMIGGMVPPLAIALATTFFANRFTNRERQSGIINYVMGLAFITEGAIPFAASDPLRVIPACAIGAAVSGGLASFLGCTLNAPHGGIFVVPVIGHPVSYIIALIIGSIVGALILGFLKKPLIDSTSK